MASIVNALTSGGGVAISGDTSGVLALQTNSGTTAVTIDTSQRVGIGTTTPTNILEIVNASNPTIRITDTTNNCYTELNATDTVGYVGTASNHAFGFTTNNTERMRIDSSGNLLVGTTTQSFSARATFYNPTANNTISSQVSSNTSSTYLGVNSSGSYTFYVTGAGQIGAVSTSITAISDARLKTNIQSIKYGLETITSLKPVMYDFIENDLVQGQPDNLGFIAQDVKEVVPELVSEGLNKAEDGSPYLTLKMGDMLPIIVKAIQEQQALITAQAETINALTARIVALESRGTV